VEIDLPGRSYVLSDVQVVSSQESGGQGETLWTFVLTFGSLSVPTTPAVPGAASTWVTIPGVQSSQVESAQLQATITAPTGSWVPGLLKDVSNVRTIATAQLALQSPARTYTLSPAYPTGATTGSESTTFTLAFTEASVQLPLPPGVYRLL
jgi:hypothetical protein